MYPELFEIPFIHLTVKSYGVMVVVGFLVAVRLMKHLSDTSACDSRHIMNVALYALVAGVAGARLLYVALNLEQFRDRPLDALAIWEGGLVFLGGVILAIVVIETYLIYNRLPLRRYNDMLAIGLMMGLAFGRIGCFLHGDCYGGPTELPWGVRFPYNSFIYISQINADPARNRSEPQLNLPREEYLAYVGADGKWYPKPYEELTARQKIEVTEGKYRSVPVHPTQLYSSANAAFLCLILYLFWRRSQRSADLKNTVGFCSRPGFVFALAFILYGVARFLIEFLRDDNPFEFAWWAVYKGGTVSQNLGIYLVIIGAILMAILTRFTADGPVEVVLDEDRKADDSEQDGPMAATMNTEN
ncbi:MAG: prolipoprotein diacylglyceryl transferase [Planctomycetota bacterium]